MNYTADEIQKFTEYWLNYNEIEYLKPTGPFEVSCKMLQQLLEENRQLYKEQSDIALIAHMQGYEEGIKASQRWIPVSERLPEESGDYLVWFQHQTGILHFNGGQWYWGDESWMDAETQKDITYWKLLPQPPTSE